jgi:hypothetical protein
MTYLSNQNESSADVWTFWKIYAVIISAVQTSAINNDRPRLPTVTIAVEYRGMITNNRQLYVRYIFVAPTPSPMTYTDILSIMPNTDDLLNPWRSFFKRFKYNSKT